MTTPTKIIKNLLNADLIPIPLHINQKIPKLSGWTKTTKNQVLKIFKKNPKSNIGVLCGETGNLTVIDVDIYKDGVAHQPTLEWYNEHKEELHKTRVVKTTSNNYHFYYKYTPDLVSCNLRSKGLNIEIKNNGNQVVSPPSSVNGRSYIYENDIKRIGFPNDLKKFFSGLNGVKKKKNTETTVNIPNKSDLPDVIKDYPIIRIVEQKDRIIYDMDKSTIARQCPYASKIHQHNNCYFEYDKTIGCLYHLCRKCSQPQTKEKIVLEYDEEGLLGVLIKTKCRKGGADGRLAKIFYKIYKRKYIYCDKLWYSINENNGKIESCSDESVLYPYIQQFEGLISKCRLLKVKDHEDLWKTVETIEDWLNSDTFISKFIRQLKRMKSQFRNIAEKIDMNPNLIGFNNGVYELRTGKFRNGKLDDLISFSTGYNYTTKRDGEIQREIETFINQIYTDPELAEYAMLTMASTLNGKNMDHILPVWEGMGGNGKSVLKDLIAKTFGDYSTELDSDYLDKIKKNAGGADPQLYDSVKKLYLFFSEPTALHASTIKKLTGGDKVKVRNLYMSKPITIIPKFTTFILLNRTADLKIEDTSNGTQRRVRVIPHTSLFTDNPNGETQFKKDIFITDKFDGWRMEFFHMLVDKFTIYTNNTKNGGGIMKNYPKCVGEHSKRFLNEDNPFKDWISEYIEQGTDLKMDRLSRKMIWTGFSEWWIYNRGQYSLNKPTRATLVNNIESSLGKLFKARGRLYMPDGTEKGTTNLLIGYRLKPFKAPSEECYIED